MITAIIILFFTATLEAWLFNAAVGRGEITWRTTK